MIELLNLKKSFGTRILFTAENIQIPTASMVAFLGESGAGKTTLLNMISLLDSSYEGKIVLDGLDTSSLKRKQKEKERIKLFSYVFSEDYLLDYLTPKENILFACKEVHKDIPPSLWKEIEDCGLFPLLSANVKTLSQGERQRFSVFRALALERRYLICDEPTAHLDHINSQRIMELLQNQKSKGTTVLVSLHDQSLLEYFDTAYRIENYGIHKIEN